LQSSDLATPRLTLIGHAAAVVLIFAYFAFTLRYRFDLAPFMTLAAFVGYRSVSITVPRILEAWHKRLGVAAAGLCVLGSHYVLLVHKSAQRDRRNVSDQPRRVQAEAIPCPLRARRWPRRFGERGWLVRPQGGDSAAGLGARPPTQTRAKVQPSIWRSRRQTCRTPRARLWVPYPPGGGNSRGTVPPDSARRPGKWRWALRSGARGRVAARVRG
jgi:hypothetical protein